MDQDNAKSEFKSHMARIAYLAVIADTKLAEQIRRELNEQVVVLTKKLRKSNEVVLISQRGEF